MYRYCHRTAYDPPPPGNGVEASSNVAGIQAPEQVLGMLQPMCGTTSAGGLLPEQGPQLLLPLGGHKSLLLGHGDGVLLPVLDGDESLQQEASRLW